MQQLTPELIERFMKVDPAQVGHFIGGGYMHPAIKPLKPEWKIIGPAYTVKLTAKDSTAVYKDAVNAAFMICEMFAFYKTRGVSLLQKLEEIYLTYGCCLNTLHSYEFPGSSGMAKMAEIMKSFHKGLDKIAGMQVVKTEDYLPGLNGLPKSDVLKFFYEGEGVSGSVVVRPSGTEPKLKLYISVTAVDRAAAGTVEKMITADLKP